MSERATTNRPRLACEIMADHVIAGRRAERDSSVEVYTTRRLPAGSLHPGLTESNLLDSAAVREAVSSALEAVSGRGRDLTLVLPDAAVRVTLMDFDTLPQREEDVTSLLRFRLRKSVPFDVDKAALSFHSWRSNGAVRVAVAAAPAPLVEEYESLVRDAGFQPGVVLPSMLAALGAVEGQSPTLVLKVDASAISTAIVEQDELRFLRTLENRSGRGVSGTELADAAYPSLVFYEDTFGHRVERALLAGLAPAPEIYAAFEAQTGVKLEELVTSGRVVESLTGDNAPRSLLAGIVGAFA